MLTFVGLGVALGFGVCGLDFGISGCWVVGFWVFGFWVRSIEKKDFRDFT